MMSGSSISSSRIVRMPLLPDLILCHVDADNVSSAASFAETFGHWDPATESYQVSGPWQAGLSNGANAGIVIGGFLNGYLSQKYGYKKVVLGALFLLNWLLFILFFASSPQVLLVGQILCGLTFGIFATTGPAYASEVCPLALRGYLTAYVNLWCGSLQGHDADESC